MALHWTPNEHISYAFIIYPVHKYIITTALICRLKIYPNLSSVKNQPKSCYRYVARRHNWQCKHLTLLLNSTVIHWKLFLSTSNFCLGIWGVPLYAQRYRKWKPISATNSSGLAAGQLSRLVLECWSWNFEPCFVPVSLHYCRVSSQPNQLIQKQNRR